MGLFFDVLSAINNPNQQASVSQLATITNTIQQVASTQGFDASKTQSILSALGPALRPMLAQQGAIGGNQLEDLLGRAGAGANASTLNSLLPPQLLQQLIQGVAQKTGISPNMLQSVLPTLIPAALGLLGMGASKPGTPGGNPLLDAFLKSDRNANLGEVFKFANRFLEPAHS